jgi:Spy/CpxP family protein refolding chaperone
MSLIRTTWLICLMLTAALGFRAGRALADERGDSSIDKMVRELDLTAAQMEKLKVIHAQALQQIKPKKAAMNKTNDDLESLLQGKATGDELRAKFGELVSRQEEFARARFDKLLAIREILTPEQRKKLNFGDHRIFKKNCTEGQSKNP